MKRKTQIFSMILVFLFLGSAFGVLASTGEKEKGDYGVVLTIEEKERKVSRNERAIYKGTIENIGKNNDSYEISFGGKDYGKEGVSVELVSRETEEEVNLSSLPLDAGEEFAFLLYITVERDSGDYEISIMVRSNTDENIWDAVKTRTKIVREDEKKYRFSFEVGEKEMTTRYGVAVNYFMVLANTGNVEDKYTVKYEFAEEYPNVEAKFIFFRENGGETELERKIMENGFEISLDPGEKIAFSLEVVVSEPREENKNGEKYLTYVSVNSNEKPDLRRDEKLLTIIKDEEQGVGLVFTTPEPEKRIPAGGTAEYVLILANKGWAPLEASLRLMEHQYPDVEAHLYLIAPHWLMDQEMNNGQMSGNLPGFIYTENGEVVYLSQDDVEWRDYGGLIPVDPSFSYTVYPDEQIKFLLRVTHIFKPENGDVKIDIYSSTYEIAVRAQSDDGFNETVVTHTEVVYRPQYGIEMMMKESKKFARPNLPVKYVIHLENTGDVEEAVTLTLGGEAYGLKGVSAYLYIYHDWKDSMHYNDDFEQKPIVIYDEEGLKEFYQGDDEWNDEEWWMPEPIRDELQLSLGVGENIKVVLEVVIYYERGVYNLTVEAMVNDHLETAKVINCTTVVEPDAYTGFEIKAPFSEQTAQIGEEVDYPIVIYNPSYYTEEVVLELGGKDLYRDGVDAQLFIKRNVYYFEPAYNGFMRKENHNFYLECGGFLYEPNKEIEDDEGTYFDNTGGIYKDYEYERKHWEEVERPEIEQLIPLTEGGKVVLGPFEEIWLLMRVSVENQTGVFNIDLVASSLTHPNYRKIVSTETTIKEGENYGLELFIGDPVHYTAYGVTTIYVFQLTNTGDVRDRVLLEVEGPATTEPNVYIEIGVKSSRDGEPLPLKDDYGNLILPYEDSAPFVEERYLYKQWAEEEEKECDNEMPFEECEMKENEFERQFSTPSGEMVGCEDHRWNSSLSEDEFLSDGRIEPVEYSHMNWGEEDGEIVHMKAMGKEMCQEKEDFHSIDYGFVPFQQFGRKYVDIEAGETIIVTMKVSIYKGNSPIHDETEMGEGMMNKGMSGEMGMMHHEKEEKVGYRVTLVARSTKSPHIVAEAKTITYLYHELIQQGMMEKKVSAVFHIFARNTTQEILEKGFELLPLILESKRIEFKVRANFSEGRVIILNINTTNLREIGDFDVLFDREKIREMNRDKIMNYSGDLARYAGIKTDEGMLLLIYIPHFSEHTITVQSAESVEKEEYNGAVIGAGLLLILLIGFVGMSYILKKEEERKKEFKLKMLETEEKEFLNLEKNEDEIEKLLNEDLFFGKKI